MIFLVKRNSKYRELIIKDGGSTLESGLLDEKERLNLANDLQEVIDDLLHGLDKTAKATGETL